MKLYLIRSSRDESPVVEIPVRRFLFFPSLFPLLSRAFHEVSLRRRWSTFAAPLLLCAPFSVFQLIFVAEN